MSELTTGLVPDLPAQQLDVYESRDGWWNPDHGDVEVPTGWALLPSGDAFVTRTVKATGVYWLAWQPRSRSRRHRRLIGLLAPEPTITAAEQAAAATAAARARRREQGARTRERQEVRYRSQLERAVVAYLAFAPEHEELAHGIAAAAATRAAEVGSGRVGRTRLRPLEERAELAVRAEIRHSHTAYHRWLDDEAGGVDDEMYRQIKREAHRAVDVFLASHRSAEV